MSIPIGFATFNPIFERIFHENTENGLPHLQMNRYSLAARHRSRTKIDCRTHPRGENLKILAARSIEKWEKRKSVPLFSRWMTKKSNHDRCHHKSKLVSRPLSPLAEEELLNNPCCDFVGRKTKISFPYRGTKSMAYLNRSLDVMVDMTWPTHTPAQHHRVEPNLGDARHWFRVGRWRTGRRRPLLSTHHSRFSFWSVPIVCQTI